jgi:rod shape-determining protein MreD
MSYCFNISVCLFLVILQTTVMPYLSLFNRFYDLLIPFIIYLGLSRPVRESLPFVFFLGFIMDNLSGGPFGLYLTTYFWFFIGVIGITKLIQVGNRPFILILIAVAGVLTENLIFLGTFAIFSPDHQFSGDAAKIITIQVLWAVFTGPLFLMIFRKAQGRLDVGFKVLYTRKGEQSQIFK